MGNYTIFWMFENRRTDGQAINFTTNVPKILDLKSSSKQIFSKKLTLGAPEQWESNRSRRQALSVFDVNKNNVSSSTESIC